MDNSIQSTCRVKHLTEKDHPRFATLILLVSRGSRGSWVSEPLFSSLLAGAGVKGGFAFGETDEFGINITANPVHVHDYHATIFHLMGIDHTRLIYRYAKRDFRLTDVDGEVVTHVLA
jgi:Protein of unknown function (DUF1501)